VSAGASVDGSMSPPPPASWFIRAGQLGPGRMPSAKRLCAAAMARACSAPRIGHCLCERRFCVPIEERVEFGLLKARDELAIGDQRWRS
jgi:hypothetical protein